MASKRNLKKSLRYVCGDIAGECLFSEYAFEGVDGTKMSQVIINLANLQDESVKKVSVCFDKSARDFETKKQFNEARSEYFKKCYSTLKSQFNDGVKDIVKDMNALLPSSQKEANKKA